MTTLEIQVDAIVVRNTCIVAVSTNCAFDVCFDCVSVLMAY